MIERKGKGKGMRWREGQFSFENKTQSKKNSFIHLPE